MERRIVLGDDATVEPLSGSSWAVFNAHYWDTAVFGRLDMAVFDFLRRCDGPTSESAIVQSIISQSENADPHKLADYCGECLRQMEMLGLVRFIDASGV
ncbi:hypothetical protein CKO51_25755 [Rhodopirellula sp. SM50]|nr:hypothetical protein [Rhodopirellula sp. SM50]PAY16584.1 hypothetical protein CKO51_25755 [Rhodopirellula sp. SM50]